MKIFGIMALVVILALGSYIFLNRTSSSTPPPVVNTHTIAPQPTVGRAFPEPTIDNSELKAGGSSFRDNTGTYVFLYPSDYVLDKEPNEKHVRIYKKGPTQTGQTEMYDGVIVEFEIVRLGEQNLDSWLDMYLNTMTKDGTVKLTQPKKSITLNSYPGYTYTTQSLGTGTYFIVQKDTTSNNAVLISTLVSDPKNVGFQTQVNKTLSTLEIFK